jgi:hypothetical protein
MNRFLFILAPALLPGLLSLAFAQNTQPAADSAAPPAQPKASWTTGSSFTLSGGGGRGRGARGAGNGAASATKNLPFNAHDISGVWWLRSSYTWSPEAPPMTAWGQAKYDAAKPGLSGPKAQPLGNDPMMSCEPMGFPRILLYQAVPTEFMQVSGRVIVFHDWFHTWRTIWTDGRELPKAPEPRWLGYSVGKWDGDTFTVESNGFDERPWIDFLGHPQSTEMRITERYKRIDHDTMQLNLVITDPKSYTKPWVSDTKTYTLDPNTEIGEDFCVPSEEEAYKQLMREPAATKPR